MAGTVRPVVDERDGLLAFLAQQRDALRFAVHGLTDEQASASPSVSALNLAGLVKHAALVERTWIQMIPGVPKVARSADPEGEYERGFNLQPGETLANALALYAQVAQETETAIAGARDMADPVPIPKGVPWFPQDEENWSVRWVLLHLIEETARHAGHADIIRESLDGQTAYVLMAAAEGWDISAWTSGS